MRNICDTLATTLLLLTFSTAQGQIINSDLFPSNPTRDFILNHCRNTPKENHPVCYLKTKFGSLTTGLTSKNKIQLTISGDVAKTFYIHNLYWNEVVMNRHTADNVVVNKNMVCEKKNIEYSCVMYYDLDTFKFINNNGMLFKEAEVGDIISSLETSSIKTRFKDFSATDFDLEFTGDSASRFFNALAPVFGQTTTIDSIIEDPNRQTTHHQEVVCHKNLFTMGLDTCRLIFDTKTGLFDAFHEEDSLLYGIVTSSHEIIGAWGGKAEDDVPAEEVE